MKSITILATLVCFVAITTFVYGQTSGSQFVPITVAIFDQHPKLNPNFEPADGSVTPGLVKTALDPISKVPELKSLDPNDPTNYSGRMVNPSMFKTFFKSDNINGTNYFLNTTLTLNQIDNGFYEIFSDYFFPIDNQGFDAPPAALGKYYDRTDKKNPIYHNWHFCLKMGSYFKYKLTNPPMQFNFRGDDDVWVFINNILAVDLGGLHTYQDGSIVFDQTTATNLGLSDGGIYSFDFFYCERHTTGSHMRFQINFPLPCDNKDYCGVCNGHAECCNPYKTCPQSTDKCKTPVCPPWNTPISDPSQIGQYCTFATTSYDNLDNACFDYSCNSATGGSSVAAKPCAAKPCQTSVCNNATGCSYTSTCVAKDNCETASCGTGSCVKSPVTCTGTNKCLNYFCNPSKLGGCDSKPNFNSTVVGTDGQINYCKYNTCDPATGALTTNTIANCTKCNGTPNKCEIVSTCDANTGNFTFIRNPRIDDGNACTVDDCNNATGVITNTPIPCAGCSLCDPALGKQECTYPSLRCDDSNPCTQDICNVGGNCSHPATACPVNATDKCQVPVCDSTSGCGFTPLVCPTPTSLCQESYCDPNVGCAIRAKNCTSPVFCTEGFCDERLGCLTMPRRCIPDRPNCQNGVCFEANATCQYHDIDPQPFVCSTAKVVSVGVAAAIAVAGAVGVGAAIFGGKKGYDYWKETKGNKITMANSNPMYEVKATGSGENPLFMANE